MPEEENKEIKKFNPEDSLNSVKDRIKDVFVSLIPDEQWNAMIEEFMNKNSGKILADMLGRFISKAVANARYKM